MMNIVSVEGEEGKLGNKKQMEMTIPSALKTSKWCCPKIHPLVEQFEIY